MSKRVLVFGEDGMTEYEFDSIEAMVDWLMQPHRRPVNRSIYLNRRSARICRRAGRPCAAGPADKMCRCEQCEKHRSERQDGAA